MAEALKRVMIVGHLLVVIANLSDWLVELPLAKEDWNIIFWIYKEYGLHRNASCLFPVTFFLRWNFKRVT